MGHTRVNFIMKKPGGGRKSFSILRRTFSKDLVQYQVVKIEALSAINKAYLSGLQQYSECEVSVREVIKRLYAEENRKYPAQVYNSQNRQLLEKYWKAEYVSRDLVDSCSAKNDLKRAIEAVGSLSLYSSSKEEIQNQISKSLKGNQQRRVVSRLNQILKFLGRDIKLRKDKSVPHEIRHLSLSEFYSVTLAL
ncbi:MAG: hypothetical protein JNJ49_02350 [Bdellovibrionaceae bacterium]|nr:hypothetical protein [Pseudobdellovibrionaceae bacterium]